MTVTSADRQRVSMNHHILEAACDFIREAAHSGNVDVDFATFRTKRDVPDSGVGAPNGGTVAEVLASILAFVIDLQEV